LAGKSTDHHRLADRALVERCLQGDDQAWTTLLERYGGLIYSIILKFDLPPEEVADVFQSVCLTTLKGLGELKTESKLSSWLTTITLWQCRQLLEDEFMSHQVHESIGPLTHGPTDLCSDEAIQQMERERLLQQALSMMEEPSRRLLLSLFQNQEPWSDEANAKEMDVSVSATALDGCLQRFMGALNELGFSA